MEKTAEIAVGFITQITCNDKGHLIVHFKKDTLRRNLDFIIGKLAILITSPDGTEIRREELVYISKITTTGKEKIVIKVNRTFSARDKTSIKTEVLINPGKDLVQFCSDSTMIGEKILISEEIKKKRKGGDLKCQKLNRKMKW